MADDADSEQQTRNQISRWRLSAEEARKTRAAMTNPEARATLTNMAETYDRLADTAQARLDWSKREEGKVLVWKRRAAPGDTKG